MNQISIKPELFIWARKRAGFEAVELLKWFPKLIEWEQGVSSPTLRQLEALAKKLLAPLGYFFLQEPPEEKLPIPDFRSIHDAPVQNPSPDLMETIFSMQTRQAWFRDFVISEGAEPLGFVGSASLRDKSEDVAGSIQATIGIKIGWGREAMNWEAAFGELWSNIERAGIMIVRNGVVGNNTTRILDVEEFRGFVLLDPYVPLIFINNADAKAAQMFTLAHELAHVWIGSAGVLNFRDMSPADNETEIFCNAVAAEMLVPRNGLASAWQGEKSFNKLAAHFKVSPLVIARRLLDVGYIDREVFFNFYKTFMASVRAKKEGADSGGNFYSSCDYRIGRPLAAAIGRAVKSGKMLYSDAYRMTGIKGPTFDRYVLKIDREGG